MIIIFKNSIKCLDDLGIYINHNYRNIRFLFEIDFSKDDYMEIKKLFQEETQLVNTYFKDDFFLMYFRNNSNHRIPFLILLIGFIRYEYLNTENKANFFDNFLKNTLQNNKANAQDFRKSLIGHFFRWRGKKDYDDRGLYIYDTQTSEVSLKIENSGKNKYLNSFIFHSGGISEQDLKEYLKIIKYLSQESIEISNLNQLYQNKDFIIYSNKINNLFKLLDKQGEIAQYIQKFIIQSIATISGNEMSNDFKLPLYIKNYLLFIGKYGDELEKININETDFIYENESILFTPNFYNSYRNIENISFKFFNKVIDISKKNENYIADDFRSIRVPIDNIKDMFTIELLIDRNIFKRYDINFFKEDFILLDNDFNIKTIINKEIHIPKKDEDTRYYIVSSSILDLELSNDKDIDNYFIYEIPLDMSISTIDIDGKNYILYFAPTLKSTIEYEDKSFLYTGELPRFNISHKDKEKFEAIDLLNDTQLDYNTFYLYDEPIGKFEIKINQINFRVIYIEGFKIKKWFNWYEADKNVEIDLSTEKIKTNIEEVVFKDGKYTYTFYLKEEENKIYFNQINGNNIQLELLKPIVTMSFLDKRKKETKIQSKNIKFERLNFYRQLKIQLSNYPTSIKFDTFEVGVDSFEVMKHNDNYFLPIKKIKDLSEQNQHNHLSIVFRNKYYFLPITDIIFDNKMIINKNDRKEIKISDIYFLMNNRENIKYHIKNKAYFIDGFEFTETNGHKSEMLILKEARETKKETRIKKNFRNIKEDEHRGQSIGVR